MVCYYTIHCFVSSLLTTLLAIASDHPRFVSTDMLSGKCVKFLADFENSFFLLETKLQKVVELAEQNRYSAGFSPNFCKFICFKNGIATIASLLPNTHFWIFME